MRTSSSKTQKSYLSKEFDHPAEVSMYFGFIPIIPPEIGKTELSIARHFGDHSHFENPFEPHSEEKAALFKMYSEVNFSSLPHPLLLEFRRPLPTGVYRTHGTTEVVLEIIGLSNAAAEAIAIRAASSVLEDEGYENLELRINSLGDKESIAEFERGLLSYIRRNINEMPADLRKAIKRDVFELPGSSEGKWQKWRDECPKSINFLSESSRNHLKEFIEYIEALGFNYQISHSLVGNPKFCTHTIFEIISETNSGPQILAYGYRYNRLSKRVGLKRDIPSLSVTLSFKGHSKKKGSKGPPKPHFYLVQIGYAAKLKTLNVVESLRKARISVVHSIAKDKLSSQMSSAENFKTTHVIIIGQKEAMEDSVVVRDNNTRVQETVPIPELAAYLRKLK